MTVLPPPTLPRLDDDEAAELEALLDGLAGDRPAGYTVPGRLVDGQAAAVTRTATPWESTAGTRGLELLEQLATTGARLARLGAGAGKTTDPAHARALPYVDKPLELLEQLAGALAAWAVATHRRDLAEWEAVAKAAADAGRPEPPRPAGYPTLTAPDAARYLLDRLPALTRRPGTTRPELDQLRRLVRRGRGLIDRAPDRWYAGPCATPRRDDAGDLVIVDGEQAYCDEDLYARPRVPVVVCRACGAEHRVEARRAELLRLARDRELRAADLSRALTALGTPVTGELLRQWKRRGLLGVATIDEAGVPLYRVGDVIDLVVAQATRTRRPRKDRTA